jgi:hypothetical protein
MSATSKNIIILLTMVCLTSTLVTIPKENTLGALITRNAKMYQNRSI